MAEFSYNENYHFSIGVPPYKWEEVSDTNLLERGWIEGHEDHEDGAQNDMSYSTGQTKAADSVEPSEDLSRKTLF